jgi:hypothetical protein
VRLTNFDQTKCIGHHPWCGDDAYVLTLGIVMPLTMVGANATPCHGDSSVPYKYVTKGVFGPGTILHKIMYCRESHNEKLLKLVRTQNIIF